MLVLLDSSMLMIPIEKKINLSSELERILTISFQIVVPEIIIRELKNLQLENETSKKRKAQFALRLAKSFEILESKVEGHADEELIRLAELHNAIIATNDKELRQTLIEKGITVISLYGDNKLALFGELGYQ